MARNPGQQSWKLEKEWADGHINAINEVVRKVAGRIIDIVPSSFEQDTEEAIDYEIKVSSGNMACRIRRAETCRDRRDLTMTTYRPSGAIPEIKKVLAGKVRWYLYAWAKDGRFLDWMFIDLLEVRKKQLVEKALSRGDEVTMVDGSRFVHLSYELLDREGAVVDAKVRPTPPHEATG